MAKFNTQLLAERVREKRGDRSLRAIVDETGLSIATLSRLERGHYPDMYNFGLLIEWLGDDPSIYFEPDHADDPIIGQLRAARQISTGTSQALMDVIQAAYSQILSTIDEDMKA